MKIWKFYLNPGETSTTMPKDAKILSIQEQKGHICMWALFPAEFPTEVRRFNTVPTGPSFDPSPNHKYLATTQLDMTVWHTFEQL
jgi:hypothetical protein